MGFKGQIGLQFGGELKNRWEKEKRRGRGDQAKRYGTIWFCMELWIFVWKLTLIMNSIRFGMDPWICMMINLLKPRILLGFHLNPKIMESEVGKTPYGTTWLWNPSFEDGFRVNCK